MRERTDRRLRISGIAGGPFGKSDKHARSQIKDALIEARLASAAASASRDFPVSRVQSRVKRREREKKTGREPVILRARLRNVTDARERRDRALVCVCMCVCSLRACARLRDKLRRGASAVGSGT